MNYLFRKISRYFRKISSNFITFSLTSLVFLLFTVSVYRLLVTPPPPPPLTASEFMSYGEKSLVSFKEEFDEKEEATKFFKEKNYQKAINILEKVRTQKINDPEALIYLNNAEIEESSQEHYTIAVAVPLNTSKETNIRNSGVEILRGIAHAQERLNHPTGSNNPLNNKLLLKVLIADDGDNQEQAKMIADTLLEQDNSIQAVIGHLSSGVTKKVAKLYNDKKFILISPTSTATELLLGGRAYIFRTVPTNKNIAQKIVDYLNKCQHKRIVVVYNPDSKYSEDLWDQFKDRVSGAEEKHLKFNEASLKADIHQFVSKGASAMVLLPNTGTRSQAIDLIKQFNNENQYRGLEILGGDSLSNSELFDNREKTKNVVLSVPWHYSSPPNQDFLDQSKQLWKTDTVSWRTAFAYDATLVLIEALKKRPSKRQDISEILGRLRVENGATGNISFNDAGDRQEEIIQLVKLKESEKDFKFESINLELDSKSVCGAS